MTRPTKCEVTSEQLKKWGETRVALSWHCPAFTHVFMTMMDKAGSEHIALFTKDVPIAATDGDSILINPDTFFKFDVQERLFITAHEILHGIFHHVILMHRWRQTGKVSYPDGTKLKYDHELMNVAMDLVINDILIDAKIGKFRKGTAPDYKDGWLHDPTIATKTSLVIDVYRALFKKQKEQQRQGQQGQPQNGQQGQSGSQSQSPGGQPGQQETLTKGGQQRFDDHLAPGVSQDKDPHQAVKDHNEMEWQQAIASGYNLQKLTQQGKMPAGLEHMFQTILTPVVDWKDRIRALFARRLGSGAYDWQKPDRRLIVRDIYAPARSGHGSGTVVVGVDTSGSIGPKEVDMFLAEVSGILEDIKPRELILLWCDAMVHRADYLHDPSELNDIRAKGAPGRGGTDFRPVFNWVADNNVHPDAVVYLTDGMGTFPERKPDYNVIWGNIFPNSHYPFGDVIDIPKQAA